MLVWSSISLAFSPFTHAHWSSSKAQTDILFLYLGSIHLFSFIYFCNLFHLFFILNISSCKFKVNTVVFRKTVLVSVKKASKTAFKASWDVKTQNTGYIFFLAQLAAVWSDFRTYYWLWRIHCQALLNWIAENRYCIFIVQINKIFSGRSLSTWPCWQHVTVISDIKLKAIGPMN